MTRSRAKAAIGLGAAVVFLAACGVELGNKGTPAPPPNAIGEHRFLQAAPSVKLETGGDCAGAGSAACLSNVCLHVGQGIHDGYVCTKACADGTDCPAGFDCHGVSLSSDERLCVPHRDVAPGRFRNRNSVQPEDFVNTAGLQQRSQSGAALAADAGR